MSIVFRVISVLGVLGVAVAVVLHYNLFGPKYPEIAADKRDVKRFSIFEILIHCLTVLSFLLLGATGLGSVICGGHALQGWSRVVHIVASPVFAVGLALMSVRWAEDSRFALHDWDWAKKFGGYLGDKGHVDAGRFNGGQKAFFWVMCLLGMITVSSGVGAAMPLFGTEMQLWILWAHRLGALCMILAAIIHFYLGSAANPGTLLAVVTGRVSKRWAEYHHSLWLSNTDK